MHQAAALQDAMQHASTNLAAIEQDPLLAGELSAVGGFWLLRRFLPAVQAQPDMVLQGLGALPGLGYKVRSSGSVDVRVCGCSVAAVFLGSVGLVFPCAFKPVTQAQRVN